IRRVLHHALLLGGLEFAQRGVDIAEVELRHAEPEMRRVGDDRLAGARGGDLVRHLRQRGVQRVRAGLVILRADGAHAEVVRLVPLHHREEHQRDHWKAGSFADSGSANCIWMSCSSPARTSTTLTIGAPNAGLVSVISYLPGARSSGAGVTVGWIVSSLPLATFLIEVISPQGKALTATRPGRGMGMSAACAVCGTG